MRTTPISRFLRLASASLLALALLAGCATTGTAPGGAPPGSAPARVYHPAIELGGRLSVRYQQNGEQALHGSFTWSQSEERSLVSLLSPLGQTLATIEVTPAASILVQSGQPPQVAADVDALAANALGWPLPVSGLREWLQGTGTDAANRRFMATPEQQTPVISSDGWTITYASWQEADGPAAPRPRRIDLERDTAQAGKVAIRLVIDNWQPR